MKHYFPGQVPARIGRCLLLTLLMFSKHHHAACLTVDNATFFDALPATYCPDDRWYTIRLLDPADVVDAAHPNGEKYTFLQSASPIITAPSGSVIDNFENKGLIWNANIFKINPYLLGNTNGTGTYTLSLYYRQYKLTYDPTASGSVKEILIGTTWLHFKFDMLSSAITFNFRTPGNVDGGTICNNLGPIELTATPAGGDYSVNGGFSGLSFVGNQVFLDPKIVDYSTVVAYTYGSGVCATLQTGLSILPVPDVSFDVTEGCLGAEIPFVIAVQAPAPPPDSYTWQMDSSHWEFGDGPALPPQHWPQLYPDMHTFQHTGYYSVKLNFSTTFSLGPDHPFICRGVYEQGVTIKEAPIVDFSWAHVCADQPTEFKGTLLQGLATTNVQDVLWDLDGHGYTAGALDTQFDYVTPGLYEAKLKVTTTNNCFMEKTKTVYKMPVVDASKLPYIENFDSGPGDWLSGTNDALANTSWTWDTPRGFLFDGDAHGTGKAWFTRSSTKPNLHYGLNEKSWVQSPCLDLSQMKSPVLNLNLRSLLQEQIDGVVVQIDSGGRAFDDAEWVTVGDMDAQHGWYDHRGIPGNPGNQALNQYGWSGKVDVSGWRQSAVPLEAYLPAMPKNRKHLRFRVALGSQGTNLMMPLDGFAFDNFAIAERDRIILSEWFTNVSLASADQPFDDFSLVKGTDEVKPAMVRLEYHLNAPQADPLNAQNPSAHNARAAYYGVSNDLPQLVIDGTSVSSPFPTRAQNIFDNHALELAKVRFDKVAARQNVDGAVDIDVRYTVMQSLNAATRLRVAVVEKIVESPSGKNHYVVRALLPDALGSPIIDNIATPAMGALHLSWEPRASQFNDAASLALVALVQDDNSRQVFQAMLVSELGFVPANVTATEGAQQTSTIQVYPNPANGYILADTRAHIVVYDLLGVEVPVPIRASNGQQVLDVQSLPDGMYVVAIFDHGHRVQHKVIVHHDP